MCAPSNSGALAMALCLPDCHESGWSSQTSCNAVGVGRHVQRLYLEVRHAVRQLHVREAGSGGSADAWYMAEGGGLKRKPVAASSLPGPWGGHKLHVQPRQAAGQESQQLPKVCHSSRTAALPLG